MRFRIKLSKCPKCCIQIYSKTEKYFFSEMSLNIDVLNESLQNFNPYLKEKQEKNHSSNIDYESLSNRLM